MSLTAVRLLGMHEKRLGDEERRLMHLVPAPAVKLMKRRVLSRPGVDSVSVVLPSWSTPGSTLDISFKDLAYVGITL